MTPKFNEFTAVAFAGWTNEALVVVVMVYSATLAIEQYECMLVKIISKMGHSVQSSL